MITSRLFFPISKACPNCEGRRKVIDPNTGKETPCEHCGGDGTVSATIGEYKNGHQYKFLDNDKK